MLIKQVLIGLASSAACVTASSATWASSYSTVLSLPHSSPNPVDALVRIGSDLYGVTDAVTGQKCNCSTIFKVSLNGTETILKRFAGNDGPSNTLIAVGGVLFGTTAALGDNGHGSVFSITPGGIYKQLYSFQGGSDGNYPASALLPITSGNVTTLYGVTGSGGGKGCDGYGCGTVYSITTSGSYKQLYRFKAKGDDGQNPLSDLSSIGGTIYGTTYGGGTYGNGTIFSVTTAGQETVLHSLGETPTDAKVPEGGLLPTHGKLIGTTGHGGTNGHGTLFSIKPDGSDYTILYSFGASATDATDPSGDLLLFKGRLYGTGGGGADNQGAVFSSSLNGSSETVVYSFTGTPDGAVPDGGLVGRAGSLYGVTVKGGAKCGNAGCGTVYKVTP